MSPRSPGRPSDGPAGSSSGSPGSLSGESSGGASGWPSGWRGALDRWADTVDQNARDLRASQAEAGHDTIAEAPDRVRVTVRGVLRTVTLRPRDGVPVLEAELEDGSGVLTLTWLGRRRIAGIAPGRALRVTGRIGLQNGVRVMFNPRYELIP